MGKSKSVAERVSSVVGGECGVRGGSEEWSGSSEYGAVRCGAVRCGAVYGNTRRTEWCEVEEKRGGRDRKSEKEMERERESSYREEGSWCEMAGSCCCRHTASGGASTDKTRQAVGTKLIQALLAHSKSGNQKCVHTSGTSESRRVNLVRCEVR